MVWDTESVLIFQFMLLGADVFAFPALKSWFKSKDMIFR